MSVSPAAEPLADSADETLARVHVIVSEVCAAADIDVPRIDLAPSPDDVICSVQRSHGQLVLGVSALVAQQPGLEQPLRAAIAHEVGHIVSGHLDHSYLFCFLRVMLADVVHMLRLNRWNPLWRCETEADEAAARLVGKEQMISLLNNCRQTLLAKGKEDRGTLQHPPYGRRIITLQSL